MMHSKICKGCSKPFETKYCQARFCQKSCREKTRGTTKNCLNCRKQFIGRDERSFCSLACFGLFHREATIDRNIRNRKYPKIDGLSRQKVFWLYNPDARKKDLARDINKRERLISHLGGCCVKCGYKEDIRALELDHKNNDGDKDRKHYGSKISRHYIKNLDEAEKKLQVLCANCNKIKAVKEEEHAKSKRTKFIYKKL